MKNVTQLLDLYKNIFDNINPVLEHQLFYWYFCIDLTKFASFRWPIRLQISKLWQMCLYIFLCEIDGTWMQHKVGSKCWWVVPRCFLFVHSTKPNNLTTDWVWTPVIRLTKLYLWYSTQQFYTPCKKSWKIERLSSVYFLISSMRLSAFLFETFKMKHSSAQSRYDYST